MSDQKRSKLHLNAGTGMAIGVLIGAVVALMISTITGDQSVWSWAIPVGLASGLAIGAGSQRRSKNDHG